MVKTVILASVLILMMAFGYVVMSWDRADEGVKILNEDDYKDMETNYEGGNMEYQGPVPEGYDLEHFRKTGETIKEEYD